MNMGFGLGAGPAPGRQGTEHTREYRSTQKGRGHTKEPDGKSQVCEMSSMESSWRGLRLGGTVLDYGRAKEVLWEVKHGFALLLFFKSAPKRLDMNPLGPEELFYWDWEPGHGERECLVPVLISPQNILIVPHIVLQGKTRPSAVQAGENRAGSLALSRLTFQIISLWEAGRDLLISTGQARLAAGSSGTRLCFSRLEQSARSRQALTSVSRISVHFKYISKAANTAPKCCRHRQANK